MCSQPLLLLMRQSRRVVRHLTGFATRGPRRRHRWHFSSHYRVHKVYVVELKDKWVMTERIFDNFFRRRF